MTNAQKLDIKRSELDSKRSELRIALIADDNMSAADREAKTSELVAAEKEYKDTSSEWRTAAALEATEEAKLEPVENRMTDLVGRVELRNYLDAATRGISVTGAEAELNKELKLDTDGEVPWAAISPVEERTDDVSGAPTNVSRTAASPLARLFAPSVAAYAGIRIEQVGVGERTYPVLTGGTSADTLAKSSGSTLNTIEANVATWDTVEVSPVRASARYRWDVSQVARMGPTLENSLKSDLAEVIRTYLDFQAIQGTGVAPYVSGLLTGLTRPATNPSAIVKTDDFLAAATALIDGTTTFDERDVRLLVNAQTYKKISAAKASNGSYLVPALRERLNGIRVSSTMPDAPTSGNKSNITENIAFSTRAPSSVVMPVWSGVRLIRDNVSDAASGVVNLTAIWLYALAKVRTGQYAKWLAKVA